MAEAPAPQTVTIPGCPPDGGPVRVVTNIYNDGLGRIRYCLPPFMCVHWPPALPIPDKWDEPPPLPLTNEPDPCAARVTAAPQQLAAASLPQPGAPLAPRLPREPRQARAPRPPRLLRAPRKPRPARRPRRARRPRTPRPLLRPPRSARPPRGRFYCIYAKHAASGEFFHIATVGPYTDNVLDGVRAAYPGAIIVPAGPGRTCQDYASDACARQAAAVVRPLQALLGWKRPDPPAPTELRKQRRATMQRPRPTDTRTPNLPAPPAPGAPAPTLPPPPAPCGTAGGCFYCQYAKYAPTGEWVNIAHIGPYTDDYFATVRAANPGVVFIQVPKDQPCPDARTIGGG